MGQKPPVSTKVILEIDGGPIKSHHKLLGFIVTIWSMHGSRSGSLVIWPGSLWICGFHNQGTTTLDMHSVWFLDVDHLHTDHLQQQLDVIFHAQDHQRITMRMRMRMMRMIMVRMLMLKSWDTKTTTMLRQPAAAPSRALAPGHARRPHHDHGSKNWSKRMAMGLLIDCYCLSLFVIVCHCLSLFVVVYHYLLLLSCLVHHLSLFIAYVWPIPLQPTKDLVVVWVFWHPMWA